MNFSTFFAKILVLTVGLVLSVQVLNFLAFSLIPTSVILQLALVTVLGAGVAFGGTLFVHKMLMQRIKKLVKSARSVEHGEKADPLKIRHDDEFKPLFQSMNNLVDRDKALREANEDPLTGLANRRYMMQRLEKCVSQGVHLALMFIDLDGFKPINDEFGHDVGDEALRMVADRMSACIRETDVLARFGGDEFVIMFTGLDDTEVLSERADKVLEMLGMPMWISGNRVRMGASIGIALYPKDGDDAESVINAADESMFAAKQGGKNAYRFYS